MNFTTPHQKAFEALGFPNPRLQWSGFDIPGASIQRTTPTKFLITVWNWHSTKNSEERIELTRVAMVRDRGTGQLWYQIEKPSVNCKHVAWKAHWRRFCYARHHEIPVLGLYKDARTGRCSLDDLFDVVDVRDQSDGEAVWLRLAPRSPHHYEAREVDISNITCGARESLGAAEAREAFEIGIHESAARSSEERLARLANAPRLPQRVSVVTHVFVRNPDVIAEALHRASGICEACRAPAPFQRRVDDTPYLEVHHCIPLAVGGEDTLENVMALCPNCHREAHYG